MSRFDSVRCNIKPKFTLVKTKILKNYFYKGVNKIDYYVNLNNRTLLLKNFDQFPSNQMDHVKYYKRIKLTECFLTL